jgi:hypothetical protein
MAARAPRDKDRPVRRAARGIAANGSDPSVMGVGLGGMDLTDKQWAVLEPIDLSEAFVDATFAGAKKGGAAVGPTRRGKGTRSWRSATADDF